MYRIVLGGRNGAEVARVVALHAGDEGHAHAPGQEGIFAVGLLAAAPARVSENVDVRRPEVQAFEDVAVARAYRLRMLDAAFGADRLGHGVNCRRVEGGGQPNRPGKLGRAIHLHAVQRLAPPVVGRNLEARNRASLIHQLRRLFLERHAGHKIIHALFNGQGGIEIRRIGRRRGSLGRQTRGCNGKSCKYKGENREVFRELIRRHRSLLCYKKLFRRNTFGTAALATAWLDQPEFCAGFAERERITVTGPAFPQRLQGDFPADCEAIRPRLAAISLANSYGVFFPGAL